MDVSQETHSIWQKTEPPFFPSLTQHESVDVCVVGGGIAGLTVAYRLLREGRSVALLERNGFQQSETMHTSAHLTAALDERYFTLRQRHGAEATRLAAESHAFAIDEIERIVAAEAIDCDFLRVPGFLFLDAAGDPEILDRELAACHEAGLPGVERLASEYSPLFLAGPSLRIPRQARFHAGRYVAGLARAVQRLGGKIYAHTEVIDVESERPFRANTNRGFQVISEALVHASNVPVNAGAIVAKMAPYRSYVVGISLPKDRLDTSLFWDTADPYHYVRTVTDDNGEPVLLVGGGDHRVGQHAPSDPFGALVTWARDRLGVVGELRYRWSGQVLEPHDGLAYIGRAPGSHAGSFVITGTSGNGLTYGTLAGRLIADLVAGRENPWAEIYAPSRLNFRSLGTFVSENTASAVPYADWVTTGDVASLEEIPAGEGAILREGVQKIAVYKDDRGGAHFYSAVCPHRSGIVRWNSAEKTWDCPCHGSRFDRYGHVLNGPASTGLAAIADNAGREGEAAASA